MCIIDLIIKIDKELYIKEVRSFWMKSILLVKHFLKSLCSDYSRRELSFTEKFMDALIKLQRH